MLKIEWWVKRPTAKNGRRTFAIIQRTELPDGTTKNETVRHEAIDALNTAYHTGHHTEAYCLSQLQDIIRQLREAKYGRASLLLSNSENLKLLERFFKDRYETRFVKDKKAAYNDYRRAVEAVGSISLLTSDAPRLQIAIDAAAKTSKRQRRIVQRIRTILEYAGRSGVKLQLAPKPPVTEIRHLTETEMEKFASQLPKVLGLACRVSFYTGARFGELAAMEPAHFLSKTIHIRWQIDPNGDRTPPKWGRVRKAYVPPKGRPFVRAWVELSVEEKMRLWATQTQHALKAACKKLWPSRRDKWCTIHDMRHSYAIYCLAHGHSLEWVAKNLGDTIQVVQDYYSGYVTTEQESEAMDAVWAT